MFESQEKKVKPIQVTNSTLSAEKVSELNDAAFVAIIQDGLSFNHFQKPGVKHFMSVACPGYTPPNRFVIARQLSKNYKKYRKSISKRLSKISKIAFTVDLWKNRKRIHFTSIVAHVLNEKFESLSFVVSFRSFKGRHLSKRIKAFLVCELNKLKIQRQSIVSTTTDNGSDVKKAANKDFGIWFSCFCHNLNLVLQSLLNGKQKQKTRDVDENDDE